MVPLMRIPSLFLLAALALSGVAQAERIKDIATIQGVRDNQLVGYGLVVGLDGTGDQTTHTPFASRTSPPSRACATTSWWATAGGGAAAAPAAGPRGRRAPPGAAPAC